MRRPSSIRLRGVRPRMKKARQQHGEDSGEKNTVEGSRAASGRTMSSGVRGERARSRRSRPRPLVFPIPLHGADQAFGWPPSGLVPGRAVGDAQTRHHRYSGTSEFSYFAEPSASSVPCGLEVCLSASTCLTLPLDWPRSARTLPSTPSLARRPCDHKPSAPAYAVGDLRLFSEGRRLAEDPITLAFTTSITRTRARGAPQGALLQQVAACPLRCPKSDTQENLAPV